MRLDLASLVSPCTEAEFLSRHLSQAPLYAAGETGRFAALTSLDIDDLAAELERQLEAAVERCDPAQGESVRADAGLMILQCEGESRCESFGSEDEATPSAEREFTLQDGAVLYLPPGTWYRLPGESRRVALRIRRPTAGELLRWLAGLLADQPAFAREIPDFAAPGALAGFGAQFRNAVAAACGTPELLSQFRQRRRPEPPARTVAGRGWIRLNTRRHPAVRRATAEHIGIVADGDPVVFPLDATPLALWVFDHAPCAPDGFYTEFEGRFDREELDSFLDELTRHGLIAAGWSAAA